MSTDVHSTDSRNPEGQTVTSDPISRRTSPIPLSNISALTSSAIDDIPPDDSSILESNVGHFARSDLSEVPDSFMRGNSARSSKPTYPYEIPLQTLGGAAAGTERSPRHGISILTTSPTGAWSKCVKALKEHDKTTVEGWKEDIDTLLVFAGLFSAVLTAFNIEAYKLLQQDPSDTSVMLLAQISTQLSRFSATMDLNNSVPVASLIQSTPFAPTTRAVRINVLWFSSLVFSLVSASIGILTKQWLREYMSGAASSPRENARIRQFRHEGFVSWRIPETITLLPILLQIALVLFFVGLLDLLWSLHPVVAGVVSVLVTISLAFLSLTTILPTIRGDCPYKSSQAMSIFLVAQASGRLISLLTKRCYTLFGWHHRPWPLYIEFNHTQREIRNWLNDLIHKKYYQGWREREKAIVRSSEPHLDHHILAGADATFMDDEFLENTVRPCINDTDCTAALNCLYEILDHRADSIVDGVPHWKHCEDVDGGINMLLHLVVDILPRIDPTNEACIIRTLTISDKLCRAIPFESCHTETQILYQRLFDILSRFLSLPQSVQKTAFDLMRRLYHRSETAVRPAVIQRIISYARCARIDSRHDMFHMACGMAIGFSIAPNLSASAFNSVRDQLRNMLEDLEGYIATPAPETVQSGPYLSLLLALVELWRRDSDLVSERLLRMIDKVVTGEGEADSTAGSWTDRLASSRALRQLRQLQYGRRWQPRRQNAYMPTDNLGNLGLHLPQTPEV